MKKKLPKLCITGTLQELIEAEMVLIMLGYDSSDEKWNNHQVKDLTFPPRTISCNSVEKCVSYLYIINHSDNPKEFQASQLNQIIDYVTNYKG